MTVYVDRSISFHGAAFVPKDDSPVKAVQAAYNHAIQSATNASRTAVQVEVIVRVAPLPDQA